MERGGVQVGAEFSEMEAWAYRPIPLLPNRVWRTYHGGRQIDEWQGKTPPEDGRFPEDWVASIVRAVNVGREQVFDEGLSKVQMEPGSVVSLRDMILCNPAAFLGQEHVEKFGESTALLVKLLDSSERLTIQVHPDNEFARERFASPFGKTEAWYVLGQRTIDGEPPYVMLGFKPGITPEKWKDWFECQDIDAMMNALHRIPIEEGRVYLVPGGTPHAIGPGCYLIEIQEPTDYTFRVERTTPRGESVADFACHQGLGFDSMLESFHYDPLTLDEVYQRYALVPQPKQSWQGGELRGLIREVDTDRFRMDQLVVHSAVEYEKPPCFVACVVTEGQGWIHWREGEMRITKGNTLCLPAECKGLRWVNEGTTPLTIILCYPPSADSSAGRRA